MRIKYNIRIFLITLLCILGCSCVIYAAPSKKPFVIVIDAGHGGKDVGAVDNNAREKDINLGVALQLGEMLKKKMKDVKVVYTRTDDTYYTLQQRADKANKAKGNLFISIHTNSLDANNPKRKTVEGASVYVLGLHKDDSNMKVAQRENAVIKLEQNYEEKYEGFNPQRDESYIIFEMAQKKNLSNSIKFAELAEKQLQKVAGRKGRGVHQAGFWVLWATSMPGALVEVDFICNPKSADFINSTSGQKKLAEALFKSIEQYRKELKIAENQPKKIERTVVSEGEAVTLAKSDRTQKVKTAAPKVKASKKGYSPRRRRSEASRRVSDNHNYETAYIQVNTHADSKIMGGIVTENIVVSPQPEEEHPVASKKKSKKERKERKVKPRKEKNNEKTGVRIVNGREVTIGDANTGRGRITAKENSHRAQAGSRASRNRVQTKSDNMTVSASPEVKKKEEKTKIASNKKKSEGKEKKKEKKVVKIEKKKEEKKIHKEENLASKSIESKKKKNNKDNLKLQETEQADNRVKGAFAGNESKKRIAGEEADPDSRLNRGSRNRHSHN